MKILVTGVAGFIGSHTAQALCKRGDEVVGIDNMNDYYNIHQKEQNIFYLKKFFPNNFLFIKTDIRDKNGMEELFKKEKFDKVVHLAAMAGVRPSIDDPLLYEEVNGMGTIILLNEARKNGIKNFVYASSSSVYGECTDTPFCETMKLDKPVSPYAATKKANEQIAYTFSHLHGLPTIGLRFFTVYGPSGRPDMAPFLFTKWIDEGVPLKRFGNGSTKRDYTYIDDIVEGVLASLDYKTQYEIFNIGNSQMVSLNEFIAVIEKILDKKAIITEFPMQPGDVTITYADISHAKKCLHYLPKTSIEKGMEKFIEWYKEAKINT